LIVRQALMTSAPLVSVVIPAHNDAAHLKRLLPALGAGFARCGIAHEVIVVANGCTDDTIASCPAGVVCLERPPLSPAAARNAGAAIARGPWLGFVDADVYPLPAWFDFLRALANDSHHALGNARLLAGWPVLAPPGSSWVAHVWQRVRFTPEHMPRTLDCANIVMSRRLFDELGGFNADRVAGEDVELCEEAIARGVPLVFDERLAVLHHGEPRGLFDFFRREVFHADPLPLVLRNCFKSGLDASLALTVLSIAATVVAGSYLIAGGSRLAAVVLLSAPAAISGAALAKAWVRRRGVRAMDFAEMVFLCQVLMIARTAGLVLRRSSWRSGAGAARLKPESVGRQNAPE
jgi:GT2 family glycosyltransferase